MSVDILLIDVPVAMKSAQELFTEAYKDFRPLLGSRAEVFARLAEICPEISFADEFWAPAPHIQGGDYALEFYVGDDEDPIDTILVKPHGAGAWEAIRRICEGTGWRAVDFDMGEFLDFTREDYGYGSDE